MGDYEQPEPLAFDPIADLPGEQVVLRISGEEGGGPVAHVATPGLCAVSRPVEVEVTNYRVKLFQPRVGGAELRVTVCNGTGLKACDRGVTSDPYCVVSLSGKAGVCRYPARTAVCRGTLDPVWNETFMFDGVDNGDSLNVTVYDWDRLSQDDYMGEVQVSELTGWEGCSSQRTWVEHCPVSERGSPGQGELKLMFTACWHREGNALRHSSVPLTAVQEVRLDTQARPPSVEVTTKTGDQWAVLCCREEDARQLAGALGSSPATPQSLYCIAAAAHSASGGARRAWSWRRELARWTGEGNAVGVRRARSPAGYAARWRVDAEVNRGYQLSPTYPEEVVLPAALTPQILAGSASFRTKSRFPVVAWVHPGNGAVICRCSQPQVALGLGADVAARAETDQQCLKHFAASPDRPRLTIADARPWANAEANRLRGGGSEADLGYEGCTVSFLNIDNIHAMREGLAAAQQAVCASATDFQKEFQRNSGAISAWLAHGYGVVRGAAALALTVESGESVVVHCSDGWDRTSQLVSLASLLLDGHYRTIAGFPDLIEKDWLQCGHKFRERCGLAARPEQQEHARELSPIFLQYLECITHLWRAHPQYFEYSPAMLAFVLYHTYSCRYATFLCDHERARAELPAPLPCLWAALREREKEWRNPLYNPALRSEALVPCSLPFRLLQWPEELHGPVGRLWVLDGDVDPAEGGVATRLCRCVRTDSPLFGRRGMTAPQTLRRTSADDPAVLRGEELSTMGKQSTQRVGSPVGSDASYARKGSPRRRSVPSAEFPVSNSPTVSGPLFCGGDPRRDAIERLLCAFFAPPPGFPSGPTAAVGLIVTLPDHAEFTVTLSGGDRVHSAGRRFSRMRKLMLQLHELGVPCYDSFPRRYLFAIGGPALELRRQQLHEWLQGAVSRCRGLGVG